MSCAVADDSDAPNTRSGDNAALSKLADILRSNEKQPIWAQRAAHIATESLLDHFLAAVIRDVLVAGTRNEGIMTPATADRVSSLVQKVVYHCKLLIEFLIRLLQLVSLGPHIDFVRK